NNGTAINVNNATLICDNFIVQGGPVGTPANTGIAATGAGSLLFANGGLCAFCNIGLDIAGGALLSDRASFFLANTNDIILSTGARLLADACSFEPNNVAPVLMNIQASGVGTTAKITS